MTEKIKIKIYYHFKLNYFLVGGNLIKHIFSSKSREGIIKIRPTLNYRLMRPYFGNALNLGLYPTLKDKSCKVRVKYLSFASQGQRQWE
jgi:hypothetical protein